MTYPLLPSAYPPLPYGNSPLLDYSRYYNPQGSSRPAYTVPPSPRPQNNIVLSELSSRFWKEHFPGHQMHSLREHVAPRVPYNPRRHNSSFWGYSNDIELQRQVAKDTRMFNRTSTSAPTTTIFGRKFIWDICTRSEAKWGVWGALVNKPKLKLDEYARVNKKTGNIFIVDSTPQAF